MLRFCHYLHTCANYCRVIFLHYISFVILSLAAYVCVFVCVFVSVQTGRFQRLPEIDPVSSPPSQNIPPQQIVKQNAVFLSKFCTHSSNTTLCTDVS